MHPIHYPLSQRHHHHHQSPPPKSIEREYGAREGEVLIHPVPKDSIAEAEKVVRACVDQAVAGWAWDVNVDADS